MLAGFRRGNYAWVGLLLVSLLWPSFSPARAQGNPTQAQDRAELLRTQAGLREEAEGAATGPDESHAVATPNDPDLGEQAILKRTEHYQPWTIVFSAPISYTSNVALTRTNEQSDVLFTPNVALLFVPKITGTLFGTFSVSEQQFYYNDFTELDFGSFDARAGLSYTIPAWHNLYLRAEYDYNRLTTHHGFDAFFENHALNLGAEVPFPIGRAMQFAAGLDFSLSLAADPEPPQRHDYGFYASYAVNLTRALSANAVARLAVRNYENVDRTDISGIFALGATYRFTKWFSANAIYTFATNDSDIDVFDYDVFNLGGAVSFTFHF